MLHPIIPGFFPDPSVCWGNGQYVLVNSSNQYFPGIPVHVSTDLLEWRHVGNAFAVPPAARAIPSNMGLYAPTIRFHDGYFYVITTDVQSVREGHLLTRAMDPRGPWTTPVRTPGAVGIDPDLFFDDDGTCRLTWKTLSATGQASILSSELNVTTGELIGEVSYVWQGTGDQAEPEAPHLLRHGGYLYCLLAEGGTERAHSVAIARARDLSGPWEACPSNPVLTHRGSDSPVQNTGHADFVEGPDGRWSAVFLGVRPRGFTPKFHVNGRETFLADVTWVDGWPVLTETGPQNPADTSFVDDFRAEELDPRWISHDGVHLRWTRRVPGGLEILPRPDAPKGPTIGVRARDEAWSAEVSVQGAAALQVHMDTQSWAELRVDGGRAEAELSVAGLGVHLGGFPVSDVSRLLVESVPWADSAGFNRGPDQIVFSVEVGDERIEIARFDGRLLSTEVDAGFTGRVIGVRACDGPCLLRRFRYRATRPVPVATPRVLLGEAADGAMPRPAI
jgi:hypothetical protein